MNDGRLMEKLHNVQMTYGYIPESEIEKLAEEYGMTKTKVYGVISFYSMFHTEPTGKYIIRVCNSISCHLNRSGDMVEAIKDYLGVESGQTTEDKRFTLEVVECLGHCGEGPVMMVNDKIYTHVGKTAALKILKECL
ncbi:MAG: NADH-quinone oxidoreductase subunit NuoE [Halanaerobiales bacterium]|nr:NADH-quinone oxidoreductase subunit NuoE [Halanaerobiales bacterium]